MDQPLVFGGVNCWLGSGLVALGFEGVTLSNQAFHKGTPKESKPPTPNHQKKHLADPNHIEENMEKVTLKEANQNPLG